MVRVPRQLLLDHGLSEPARLLGLVMYLDSSGGGPEWICKMTAERLGVLMNRTQVSIRRHWDALIETGYLIRINHEPLCANSARGLLAGHAVAITQNGTENDLYAWIEIGSDAITDKPWIVRGRLP